MSQHIDRDRLLASAPTFYHTYLLKALDGDLATQMERQIQEAHEIWGKEFWERRDHRYAPGKWTPTELLGHLVDSERVFLYRAMRFVRADATDLPGFEEDDYVAAANFGRRGVQSLLTEFEHQRRAAIALYNSLTEEEKWRSGRANGNPISAYAMFYANVGHFNHHVGVMRERY